MNNNPAINQPTDNSICITKFKTLSVFENGLILRNKNLEEKSVLFSEVCKIYIKKCKISLVYKINYLAISLVLISIAAKYFPLELVLLLSTISFTVLIKKMNTYKSYQLVLYLDDKTIYSTAFYSSKKQEYINLVSMVSKSCFDYRIKCDLEVDCPPKVNIEEKEFAFSCLRIF
jgi:hypothetical protein